MKRKGRYFLFVVYLCNVIYLIAGGNEKTSQKDDFETAKINVIQYMSGLMIFTEDEQQFIENFHQGV